MSLGKWRLKGESGGRAVGYARGRWGEAPCGRALCLGCRAETAALSPRLTQGLARSPSPPALTDMGRQPLGS